MTDLTPKKRSSSKTASPGRPPPFELRESSIQGRGAFATRRIRKGARITEYIGEHITQEEADARYDDESMERHHTFLFNLDEKTVVDGAVNGNDARFINHSCDPNCQAFIEEDRIFIYALRDIAQDEELCYDYAYERAEGMDDDSESLYVCRCGAKNCRGTILAPPKPPERARPVKKAAKRTHQRVAKEHNPRGPKGPRSQRTSRKGSGGRKRA
ncbi:SET domain-containing protein-lysine N-methyltransferase [Stigmatella sp. ncwal1]|uniref:SET domain-containing protein-lysine N-methyltransferase n=1 Tax=Stigmatella ashevillensis TaxID=2995309 RepID=A0ABT5DLQ4_9BACT|nr:SET domain-containing protein-lysine N-methyltransferase [Stigmatella ashevillena]MDC0714597.1 SET domain-containing protein-lysine N-methyltransferase [Stigmatella ashevillena]